MPERNSLAARALPLFTWGLVFHILTIAVLFGALHVPEATARALAAWKEAAAVLLVLVVSIGAATGRGTRSQIGLPDVLIVSWLGLAVFFFITEDVVWGATIPLKATAYGLRDIAFFVLLFFVGRATPEIVTNPRTLRRLYTVLLVTSIVAVIERIFVTPSMLVVLGVASYTQDFLGTSAYTVGNVYGLPDNYWTDMGGHLVRRAGSVYLSSQGFATPFVLLLPGATMWAWHVRRPSTWLKLGYVVIWAGLILTFTRAAIVICALQVLLILLYRKRSTGMALAAAAATTIVAIALVALPGLANFVMDTLTWQNGSSQSHLKDMIAGVEAFVRAPLGYGLGTTDQTAVRAGLKPITSDNLYLKFAVEMGLPGLLVHVAAMFTIGLTGFRLMRDDASIEQQAFGATVALGALGIAIDGMGGVLFSHPLIGYLFFWFAGSAVTVWAQQQTSHAGSSSSSSRYAPRIRDMPV
ncbi:MAG: O-antigen ligase family protein [Gemmatimonadaceae bacterium]